MSNGYHAARTAVIGTLPAFEMARMRAGNMARRHPARGFAGDSATSTLRWANQFTHTRRLLGPNDREVVTPNNDTLYTNAWLDLTEGPVLIHVPAMGDRYWTLGFLDAWTNPWAYAGRRTTGGSQQRLFVHGPDWCGEPPAGALVISAPGNDVWIIGRILVDNDHSDLEAVHALQDAFLISREDGSDALMRVDAWLSGKDTGVPAAAEYADIVNRMIERNPPALGMPGWSNDAETLVDILPSVYSELREEAKTSDAGGGWSIAVTVKTNFGQDFLTRARVARNWIGTLGIEEAMYVMAEVASDGSDLTGSKRYEVRFPPEALPQVDAFWSLTLYRRSDCLLVANHIGRYSIGDRTPGLRRNADGGLTISIQADEPAGSANWLPAPQGAPYYLMLRLYQPRAPHLEMSFRYPPVRRIA